MNVLLKYAKKQDHVSLRAKQRTKVSPEEIALLREAIKKLNLRRGETYHKTWPGRGHAIIGDVGKKRAHHVVKTMYKPSDMPPGRRLEKTAIAGEIIATSLLIGRTIAKRRAAKAADEALRKKILAHWVGGVPYKGKMPKPKFSSKARMDDAVDLDKLTSATKPGNLKLRRLRKTLGDTGVRPPIPTAEAALAPAVRGFKPETALDASFGAIVPGGMAGMPIFKGFRRNVLDRSAKAKMKKAVETSELNLMADNIRKAKGLTPLPRSGGTKPLTQESAEKALSSVLPGLKMASVIENGRFVKEALRKREIMAARRRQDHRYIKIVQGIA